MCELAVYHYLIYFDNTYWEDSPTQAEGTVIAEDEEHAIDTLNDWYNGYSFADIEIEFVNILELVMEERRG